MINQVYSPLVEMAVGYGVPLSTVTLILVLPIVVTIITFFRQIVGIKAFGIYTPAMITFAFLSIGLQAGNLAKGVKYGTAIFVMVILVGTISRIILRRFRLLYLPRMAIVITLVSFATLGVLILGGALNRTGLAEVSIFPILIMITLVEKFVATQIEKGSRTAIVLSVETLLISIISYYIISWQSLLSLVQQYPMVILLTILVNMFLGRWTGLRLMEYFRFKDLINGKNVPKK
jgi:hypothetical protein